MNKQTDMEDDVVVIEQRDKKTYLYIAIAGALGLALGGLVGSSVTASQWQKTYQGLESQYQELLENKQILVQQVEEKAAKVDSEIERKFQEAIETANEKHQNELSKLQQQVEELEKVNLSLEASLEEQKKQLASATTTNSKLNRQADMQATMFERSRELFQKELKVKQELESLQKEQESLLPKIKALKKECDVYLEGTSWDAKSDSCDKLDETNSRLSQVEQMIRVHQMDLEQIKALSEQIGL
ncbi:chromosome partitioning protein ParA [Vibrio sp. TRT 21S02]|uniref:chromosome partitioning protein ParA n=1 Tax=Vibrio sp. TRT 21S02 TaxID=3418507 RepID=UPI003CF6DB36